MKHVGPNDHEQKVDHAIYNVFHRLLDKRDPRAAQMAQELAAVAAKYDKKDQNEHHNP